MKQKNLYDERGIITLEALEKLETIGRSVSCECPNHLVKLLKQAKEFTLYQKNCINEKPADELIHKWLLSSSVTIEHIISNTIVNLARMEGMLDENNHFVE
ncbi:MAG: hypothetical protein JNM93_01705 [Bacteriovoracaceae bacterium]|nr:hypothetical protein [Bacteriovoracaceae bacterium]